MVSATNADKMQSRRVSKKAQVKRLLYILSTTSAPAQKALADKRPAYLRYIEYV
jgi:hypothetical protein